MLVLKILAVPFTYRLGRPLHVRLVLDDLVRRHSTPPQDHLMHLSATIDWLCRAQDAVDHSSDSGGVSAGWNFEDGWLPGYPETTGYIIETFIAAAGLLDRPDLLDRANRMVDWELRIQASDGAFPGHYGEPGSRPVIFNTGQIMHGMVAGYRFLNRKECLEAAVRAGHWLARHQDSDGCWRHFELYDLPHTYNTRATWALLATGLLANDAVLRSAAVRNLEWALGQQLVSGWFANNSFTALRDPFVHTIAYAIRGFLESGALLRQEHYLTAALRASRAVAEAQRPDGGLAATFDSTWRPTARYCCLTGVAQMCLNWIRLAQETGSDEFREVTKRGISYLKKNHRLDDPNPMVRGAIAGSAPIWGRYAMFEFPNWAAKFFADALMMDLRDTPIPSPLSASETLTFGATASV